MTYAKPGNKPSELEDLRYIENEIKMAILNNEPIDSVLHVIMVLSNPCQFKKRAKLAKDFLKRMDIELNIELYVVELAHGNDPYFVAEYNNPNHLRLRTDTVPLWHKENMINIGVAKLLPPNWKAMAYIDADVEFENVHWASDALKVLNGCRDTVQLFSHAVDMDQNKDAMSIFSSFGFQYNKFRKYFMNKDTINYYHPGYAFAMTRKAYETMGGIYELSILGSGDHNMAMGYAGQIKKSVHYQVHPDYLKTIMDYYQKMKRLRLGYIPGVIRHYFHGTKESRKYYERWKVLIKYQYDPTQHLTKNSDGLLVPTKDCPKEMLDEIYNYFLERNEDYE